MAEQEGQGGGHHLHHSSTGGFKATPSFMLNEGHVVEPAVLAGQSHSKIYLYNGTL